MNAVKHCVALKAGVRFIPGGLPMDCGAMPRLHSASFPCIFLRLFGGGGVGDGYLRVRPEFKQQIGEKSTSVVLVTL